MPEAAPESGLALSVCICTYNGAARILPVLEALAGQVDQSPAWEVLVIDNASTDATPELAGRFLHERLPGRGRLLREDRPGVMYARQRAAREARGALIAFVDDDNLLAPDYIGHALALMRQHPQAGVIGGKVQADWVGEPSPLGLAVADFALAICDRGEEPFAYPEVTGGPAGAGMIVRRELLLRIFEEAALAGKVTGRTGSSLLSGEDTAIVIRVHQMGYECRYEPALRMRHRIPASRTTKDYLLRLYDGIGQGQAAMRRLYDPKMKNPVLATLIALKEGLRWVTGQVRGPSPALRRQFGPLATDVHHLQQRQLFSRFRHGLKEARA